MAGVHNENDFNMLTRVSERRTPCHVPNGGLGKPLSDVNRESPRCILFPEVGVCSEDTSPAHVY